MQTATNDFEDALTAQRRALAIRQALLAAAPDDISLQREVVISLSSLALTLNSLGQKTSAEEQFRAAFSMAKKYATADPHNPIYQMDLVNGLYQLAYFFDDASAVPRARAIVERLESEGKLTSAWKSYVEGLERQLASKPI